jgi:cytochrome c556
MSKAAKIVAAALSLTLLAATASAQVVGKTEDQIRFRQSAYTTMGWSVLRIKANVEGTYNKDQVIEAANVIQAIANSKMGTLYQPGSDKGKGWEPTRLKSEFFTDKEGVPKVAGPFIKAANEMGKAAASGDQLAVTEAYEALTKTCDGCHDKFKRK